MAKIITVASIYLGFDKMERKLLSGIFSYYPRENHSPKENFVTEVLSYTLNKVPQFNQAFLELIKKKLKEYFSIQTYRNYQWKTQFPLFSGDIPDLVLFESEIPKIIVEAKVESCLGKRQIERYKQEAKKISPSIPVIMIGKGAYQNTQSADAFISWTDIYSTLISVQEISSPIGSWLLDEFADLLITMEVIDMPILQDEIINYSKIYFKRNRIKSIIEQSFSNLNEKENDEINLNSPFQRPRPYPKDGLVGLRWSKDKNPENSTAWSPSVFMGIVKDPDDHLLYDICKDEIPFIVVISINEFLYPYLKQLEEWKTFRTSVCSSLGSSWNVLDRTEFSLNPWHPFILHKPLSELFQREEPISVEKAIGNAIKEMIPIIQTAFDNSGITFKFEELLNIQKHTNKVL